MDSHSTGTGSPRRASPARSTRSHAGEARLDAFTVILVVWIFLQQRFQARS